MIWVWFKIVLVLFFKIFILFIKGFYVNLLVYFLLIFKGKWVSRLVWKFFVDKMRILEGDIGVVLNYIYIGLVFGSFYIWVFLMVRDYGEGIGV